MIAQIAQLRHIAQTLTAVGAHNLNVIADQLEAMRNWQPSAEDIKAYALRHDVTEDAAKLLIGDARTMHKLKELRSIEHYVKTVACPNCGVEEWASQAARTIDARVMDEVMERLIAESKPVEDVGIYTGAIFHNNSKICYADHSLKGDDPYLEHIKRLIGPLSVVQPPLDIESKKADGKIKITVTMKPGVANLPYSSTNGD